MYTVIDEEQQKHVYENISRIISVADLKEDNQYILVQEVGQIVIWKVANPISACFPTIASNELTDYYKRHHGRNFDMMLKKLIKL